MLAENGCLGGRQRAEAAFREDMAVERALLAGLSK